ncbi:phosphoenolpyruvate carboxykinase (ATP) [Thermovenabulum sp.]|uniref:phosphoenolpyruvate carboxykinase (ATP) n=1 Tax=Thermovenabulum sp. TaxID=3100335 RepID=UPI003C7B48BE
MSQLSDFMLNVKNVYRNLPVSKLVEEAVKRGEGVLLENGALLVNTGKYTGRSPEDKFIVDSETIHDEIWWENNKPFSYRNFHNLLFRIQAYLQNKDVFVFDGYVCADPNFKKPLRVITEYAYQSLFARQLFLRGKIDEDFSPEITVICVPGFKADPKIDKTNSEAFIILDLEKKIIIIGGTKYSGEIKKSVFSLLNYIMPGSGVFPMHCSANVDDKNNTALFFGLSGTGKTTLSADPERRLIGDDEHGWSDSGIFNFEGGCYAKCIHLSLEKEPQIYNAIKFGTILENVVFSREDRMPDYDSDFFTENTRAAYPVDYIPDAVIQGVGGHPKQIFFLSADAFGVLPPIAKLTKEQAMFYFIAGYTSKLAGTERGITEPKATFSACFGAPFLPRPPYVYAELLKEKVEKFNTDIYLVNTGWIKGPYGTGERINLNYTRAIIKAALSGLLKDVEYEKDPVFNLMIPKYCPGVPAEILNPRNSWKDKKAYDEYAHKLKNSFTTNASKYNLPAEILK